MKEFAGLVKFAAEGNKRGCFSWHTSATFAYWKAQAESMHQNGAFHFLTEIESFSNFSVGSIA